MSSKSLPAITFALLVVATFAAFFIAQRLKRSQPLVDRVRVSRYVSPKRDGEKDRARLSFILRESDTVSATVVDGEDRQVKALAVDRPLDKGRHVFHWSATDNSGTLVPEGVYHLRIVLRGQGRAATSAKKITVDRSPPQPRIVSLRPTVFRPNGRNWLAIHFYGPLNYRPSFDVYRVRKRPHLITSFSGKSGSEWARWYGHAGSRIAHSGRYLIAIKVRDTAGNLGQFPNLSRQRFPKDVLFKIERRKRKR